MDNTSTFPTHLLPTGYLEHFKINEFKFRWHDASGLDPILHFRANHLASRLVSLRITDAYTISSKPRLARITNTSIRTIDRALSELEDRGWIQVSKDRDRLSIFLVIPQHGLEYLLQDYDLAERQRQLRQTRELATQETLGSLAHAFNVDATKVRTDPAWKVIRSRIRSITNRMDLIDAETKKLVQTICEAPPHNIRCPQAFISSRIDEFLRNYTHLSHRQTKAERNRSVSKSANEITLLIDELSQQLKSDHGAY